MKIKVYCSCRMPQDRTKMARCNVWLHLTCENIGFVFRKKNSSCLSTWYLTAVKLYLFMLSYLFTHDNCSWHWRICTLYKTKSGITYTKDWTQTQEDLFWSDTPVPNPYLPLPLHTHTQHPQLPTSKNISDILTNRQSNGIAIPGHTYTCAYVNV